MEHYDEYIDEQDQYALSPAIIELTSLLQQKNNTSIEFYFAVMKEENLVNSKESADGMGWDGLGLQTHLCSRRAPLLVRIPAALGQVGEEKKRKEKD